MIKDRNGDWDVDALLRRALADDLPADVALGMRQKTERFRERKRLDETRKEVRIWLFPRSVWAALSVLMLAAGLLLQGTKPSSPLAERISVIKNEFASLEPTRR